MTEHAEVAKRRSRVLALRAMGLSNQQIAEQEGRSASQVSNDYRLALKASKDERDTSHELAGTLEAERLDRLQQTVETILRAEAQQGRCNACGRAADPTMVLKAASQLVRIAERRASLLGLDLKGKDAAPPAAEDELAKIRNRIHNEHPRQGKRRQGPS